MCIALFTTAHPDYSLILINNRDEYLKRPTACAHWWETPNQHVLGGRDLFRKEQGTWLGMTKQGRIAVLTNFREDGPMNLEARSRGAMVNAFLTQDVDSRTSTKDFVASLMEGEGLKGVGGFSLVCGTVGEPLAVVSNRTPNVECTPWIAKEAGETVGLSNAAFADRTWPKVIKGEELLSAVIKLSIADGVSKAFLIEALFHLLSDDTLPKRSEAQGWDSYLMELRNSIFIPAIGGEGMDDMSDQDLATATSHQRVRTDRIGKDAAQGDGQSGPYGTQKQIVVLIDHHGKVTFVERTLYDTNGRSTGREQCRDQTFEFKTSGSKS